MTNPLVAALRLVNKVIVHDKCPDGMASAILIKDVLPSADIQFVQYGGEAHRALEPQPNMLFCDFSPHASNVQAFVSIGAIVLDHHKTAKGVVEAFGERGVFGDERGEPGVCGAVLAYRHVWLPLSEAWAVEAERAAAEDFATLAGIRDTWQKTHPRWREACVQASALRFYPPAQWLSKGRPFDREHQSCWLSDRMALGEILLEKHERAVEATLKKAWRFTTTRGTRVVVFDGTHLTSDGSEALGDSADLTVGFGYTVEDGTQKLICSNRSRGSFDCGAYSTSYGGGGHTQAAGFSRVLGVGEGPFDPYSHIEYLVEQYEAAQ